MLKEETFGEIQFGRFSGLDEFLIVRDWVDTPNQVPDKISPFKVVSRLLAPLTDSILEEAAHHPQFPCSKVS